MQSAKTGFLYLLGSISLFLGILGMILPILPTTPFLILSAYFFSKSSSKIHNWILSRPYFGKIIGDWEKHGIITKKAKTQAMIAIFLLFGVSIFILKFSAWIGLIGLAICFFIITRPSEKKSSA
jgi:uncharacterized membrane protein YbaN (DUF454 family)